MNYTGDQATKVLTACARAAHEASVSVEAAHGIAADPWEKLSDEDRDRLCHDAAHALDLIDKADMDGGSVEGANAACDEFARITGRAQKRANLFISVVAAMKATLDVEIAKVLALDCPACDVEIEMTSAVNGMVEEGERVECPKCKAKLVVRVHDYEDPDENVAYLKEVPSDE